MMSPIQAAVALERPSMIEALLGYGASMPLVIVCDVAEDKTDAEDIARILRGKDSFSSSTRSLKDGGCASFGSQLLA